MTALAALLALAAAAQVTPPAASPGWTWSLYDNEAEVALAREIPDTNRLDAVFQCAPGSGEVKLTLYALAGGLESVELSAGKAKAMAPVGERKDQLVTRLAVSDPVFLALVDTGVLTVRAAQTEASVAPPKDKLRRLARRCAG